MDRSATNGQISICFVDEHPILLAGVSKIFASNPEFDVVAVGTTASDISEIAETVTPDLIITEMSLRGSVLEAIARVATSGRKTKVLVLSAMTDVDTAIRVLEAGAVGYVLKTAQVSDLMEAMRKVHLGETYITPSFAAHVVSRLREASRQTKNGLPELSVREIQVLRLLQNGKQNKEIASALDISEKTVKHYMTVLMQKFNARNRTEVVLAAQSHRL